MPELPEVEVVRRGLQNILKDQPTLEKIELKRKDLRDPIPEGKLKKLIGQKILSVERRAKYLLLWTPAGALLSHLGMTGTWRVAEAGDRRDHDHVLLHFSHGLSLIYRDPRRFGIIDFVDQPISEHKRLRHLGLEPLSEEFTGEALWLRLRGKTTALKVALMDQKNVVGIGNIYASEALFAARVNPKLKSHQLSRSRADKVVIEVKKVLTAAITKGGSSISDFSQTNGDSGFFQNDFKVYGRANQRCFICEGKIRSKVLGGRNSFWCPYCQK